MDSISKYIVSRFLHEQITVKTECLGEEEYAFSIMPELLKKNVTCFSFGVGENISFDMELIQRYDAKVYAFDPTPKSIVWANKNIKSDSIMFYPYGISTSDRKEKFYLPNNRKFVSGSVVKGKERGGTRTRQIYVDMRCMKTIVKELGINKVDVLKLDIEGSEFGVILQLLKERSLRFEQLCVEVHWRYFRHGWLKLYILVKKLNKAGYVIVKVSESMEEITFVKMRKLRCAKN